MSDDIRPAPAVGFADRRKSARLRVACLIADVAARVAARQRVVAAAIVWRELLADNDDSPAHVELVAAVDDYLKGDRR